jgi:dienelactone hydrolase
MQRRMRRALAAAVLWAASGAAGDWRAQAGALRPPDTQAGEKAVLDQLERRARRALEAIPRARTAAEADRQRPLLRRRLEASLGWRRLPWPPRLEARTVGVLAREGYRLEKVVWQSLPGVRVPAHLYLPAELRGPAPAILFYTGHWWAESKAHRDFQAFALNMARWGFVVLIFDAFGQGERGVSNRDHRRTEALLAGISQQGFAEYESQCALQYLLARREVDRRRIGMTGASGGGYNTWITAALDDRIRVAVPVVGTSEFYEQLAAARAHDWYRANEHCHFPAGLLGYANNHEWAAMIAPRPLLMVAAAKDAGFPVAGVRQVHEYARGIYESYGAAARLALFVDEAAGHGYQQRKREAAYGWFLRWLMERGDGRAVAEPPTETAPPDAIELRCFPPGANQPAGPGMIAAVRRLIARPPRMTHSLERLLGATPRLPAARAALGPQRLQRLVLPGEEDLGIPAFLLRPAGEIRGLVIAVDDRGKEEAAADGVLLDLLEQGWALAGVDPRGLGELAVSKPGWVFAVSLLLGENFVWRQAWDLNAARHVLAGAPELAGRPVGLYARGHNASLAAVYALAQNGAGWRWWVLRDGFLTLRHFVERPESLERSYRLLSEEEFRRSPVYDREIPHFYVPFKGLAHFDLPLLLGRMRARGLVADPINGDWKPLSEREARRWLPRAVEVVTGAGAEDQIVRRLKEWNKSAGRPSKLG